MLRPGPPEHNPCLGAPPALGGPYNCFNVLSRWSGIPLGLFGSPFRGWGGWQTEGERQVQHGRLRSDMRQNFPLETHQRLEGDVGKKRVSPGSIKKPS